MKKKERERLLQTALRRMAKIEEQIIATQASLNALVDYWQITKQDILKLAEWGVKVFGVR